MKRLIPIFLLLFVVTARAQNFEGTIKWSMKMDITDPATKAKMEEAKRKMSDPATQARMKEMQAKMNDPQMKAMMDANPQMKAQMEGAMKMMQGGDINAMMPKGFIIKIKDQNTLTKVEGGMMAMDILYLKDKDQSYHLDRQGKTYSIIGTSQSNQKPSTTPPPKVIKTSETANILGYTCTKYRVEISAGERMINQSIWATTEIKDLDLKSLAKHRLAQGNTIFYEGIAGVPMRVESNMTEGKMSMEVTEVKRESLSASDFTIPSDYKETQGMFGN